jgi:hypothetical protein
MNEQQLAALKLALEALEIVRPMENPEPAVEEAIAALQSIISQDALNKMAENAREIGLDYEPAVQEGRDWSLLEATQESLREHMAEINRLQKEIIEQCRIIAMSAEREDFLRAEIKRLKAAQPAPVMTDEKGRPLSFWGGKSVEPIAQPAPVKTYSGGKPWPVAPKPWVGLSKDDVNKLRHLVDWTAEWSYGRFAYELERLLREKNT